MLLWAAWFNCLGKRNQHRHSFPHGRCKPWSCQMAASSCRWWQDRWNRSCDNRQSFRKDRTVGHGICFRWWRWCSDPCIWWQVPRIWRGGTRCSRRACRSWRKHKLFSILRKRGVCVGVNYNINIHLLEDLGVTLGEDELVGKWLRFAVNDDIVQVV